MAEDNKPDSEESAHPAVKKKPAARKAAKKASASLGPKKAAAKKVAAKKAVAKKAVAKKAVAKKPVARKTVRKKSPAKSAPDAAPPPAVAVAEIPRAAPQPPAAAAPAPTPAPDLGGAGYESNEESGGMSGLLVTAGPLIILAFLILVMSDEQPQERAPRASTPSTSPVVVDAPSVSGSGLTEESLKELLVDDAAKDLAEAFKEVGLKLPTPGIEQAPAAAVSEAIELPAELQNNPWAPRQPGPAAAGEAVPPPPVPYQNQAARPGAAGAYNPGWRGYPGQMGGYNNPYMAYPWQPPPGYRVPVNPYWGGAVPGYGVPQGYPPPGAYGSYQPPVPGQWAPNPLPPSPAGAPPAPGQNSTQ